MSKMIDLASRMCIAPVEKYARWEESNPHVAYCYSVKFWRWLPTNIIKRDNVGRNCPMKREIFSVADIYVPVKRRATLEQRRVKHMPILVRPDAARLVLVEGLHRLEAAKALGEATIVCYRVDARKH
jgi:sulfiredoxin